MFSHWCKKFTNVFAFHSHSESVRGINLPIFEIMKLRHRKAKELGQEHHWEEEQNLKLSTLHIEKVSTVHTTLSPGRKCF